MYLPMGRLMTLTPAKVTADQAAGVVVVGDNTPQRVDERRRNSTAMSYTTNPFSISLLLILAVTWNPT